MINQLTMIILFVLIITMKMTSFSFQAGYRWAHVTNRQVILEPTNLLLLHEFERVAIQKLACTKLNASDLGINVRIPKGKT